MSPFMESQIALGRGRRRDLRALQTRHLETRLSRANISPHWPAYLPTTLVKPETTLFVNLQVAALRFGERTAIGFMGRDVSYRSLLASSERFAAWLQEAGVGTADRVAIFMQNKPQWLIAH